MTETWRLSSAWLRSLSDHMTDNTPLWTLLELDGRSVRHDSINRLAISATDHIITKHPTIYYSKSARRRCLRVYGVEEKESLTTVSNYGVRILVYWSSKLTGFTVLSWREYFCRCFYISTKVNDFNHPGKFLIKTGREFPRFIIIEFLEVISPVNLSQFWIEVFKGITIRANP